MLLSIVGVIAVQAYWIKTSWNNKDEAFSLAVNQVLKSVSTEVQNRELNDYILAYERLIDSVGKPNDSNFTDVFLFLPEENTTNLSTFFAYGILQEDYDIDGSILDPRFGNLANLSDYKSVNTTAIISNDVFNRENNMITSVSKLKSVERRNPFEVAKYRSIFMQYMANLPIHRRVSIQEILLLLNKGLSDKNIKTPFEFGVYNNKLATRVKLKSYSEEDKGPRYATPILLDDKGESPYELVVFFPKKENFVLSSLIGVAGLSIILTLFIVLVSFSALYQIIQQKKIAVMKTDFINNMSHEFKTPIATIGLAIDSILNTKTINNPLKIKEYTKMMKEENNRMLKQVEDVLRISQLERGTLQIDMKKVELNDIIKSAISHVSLIIKSRNGEIVNNLTSESTLIDGNYNHLTNVFINILDNAIKYSSDSPLIKIDSFTINKKIVVTFNDKGIGMDLNSQKLIFQKFYRVQTGNIHDIKGHGLGLTYVKKIIEIHSGHINLKSRKGYGTTFEIRIPLAV
ncbi:HAMP domain-containing histidine kinase [Flavobacteriaceae bacterium]|nr:HAMP domain-containing histidine kinase [Flavobacteriaceae bacterium]